MKKRLLSFIFAGIFAFSSLMPVTRVRAEEQTAGGAVVTQAAEQSEQEVTDGGAEGAGADSGSGQSLNTSDPADAEETKGSAGGDNSTGETSEKDASEPSSQTEGQDQPAVPGSTEGTAIKENSDNAKSEVQPTGDVSTEGKTADETAAEPTSERKETENSPLTSAITAEADGIQVKVTPAEDAAIPEGTELVVKEITSSDSDYQDLETKAEEEAWKENGRVEDTAAALPYAKYVSISLQHDGKTIEPQADVDVEVELRDFPVESGFDGGSFGVVHITDNGTSFDTPDMDERDHPVLSFSTDQFSEWAFTYTYTVDFYYEENEFSLPGNGEIRLSELMQKLGLTPDGTVIKAVYSTPEQLEVGTMENGDCTLTSLKPFTTKETLTLTTDQGTEYVIPVCDPDAGSEVNKAGEVVHDFNAEVFYGGTKQDGKYVWTARSHAAGHRFSYRVSFSLGDEKSGDDMVFAPGTVEIRVPNTVLVDRNGDQADKYEMSIPSKEEVKEAEENGEKLDNDISFAYEEDKEHNQIVITNIRDINPGFDGFIEMSYITTEETFNYKDMAPSKEFTATIKAMDPSTVKDKENPDGTWTPEQTKTVDPVYIDTQVSIEAMEERAPAQYDTWQSSWGTAPAGLDTSKYTYFVYELSSVIGDNSQEYAMSIDSTITSLLGDDKTVTPGADTGMAVAWYDAKGAYAIKDGIGQRSDKNNDGTDNNQYNKETGLRYDYVVIAFNKEFYAKTNKLDITTSTTATVHPRDDADGSQATSQTFQRRFVWNKPTFNGYGGGFGGWVRADGFYRYMSGRDAWPREYFTELGNHAASYSSYDLNGLIDNKKSITGLDYAVWTEGYVGSWSIDRNSTDKGPGDYFKEPVRYEMTDNQFFLSDENDGVSNNDEDRLTSSDDYQIDTLRFNVYAYDAAYDSSRAEFVNSGKVTYGDDEVLTFYVQKDSTDAEFVKAAEYNLKSKTFTNVDADLVKKTDADIYGGPEIDLQDGIVGYRVETKNTHYYTRIGVVPSVTLKASEAVLSHYHGKSEGASHAETESFALNNRTVTTIYDYKDKDGNTLEKGSEGEYQHAVWGPAIAEDADFIRKVEKYSSLTKDIVASTNLQRKKEYRVTWKTHLEESYNYGQNEKGYVEQNGGTFYDLLPIGAVLDPDSIDLETNDGEMPANSYSLETLNSNYENTGRTLVKITVYDPADWYDLYYDTVHTYEAIRDYGNEAYNSVAYETGNDSIEGFFQNPDNPTKDSKVRSQFDQYLSDVKDGTDKLKNAEIDLFYRAVDAGSKKTDTKDDHHFLFRGRDGELETITAAASGLTKRILSERSSRYDTEAIVDNNSTYHYRLRFQNSYANTSDKIILYDDLENYEKDDRSSDWKGILTAIDFSALPKDENGNDLIAPVVYYSNVAQNFDGHTAPDLSTWTKLNLGTDGFVPEDLQSSIRAIAIDLSKKTDGSDFTLDKGAAVSVALTMTAPSGAVRLDNTAGYPESYNGVLISYERITDSSIRPQVTMEGSTTAKLVISRDVNIKKLSNKDNTSIRGIQFRLYGTSDYGTPVDKILSTDRNGELIFAKVEKGTYTLMEYGSNPEWLDDHTAYTVKIDDQGRLFIKNPKDADAGTDHSDGKEYARTKGEETNEKPFMFTVYNTPRIHGDLSFYKARQTTKDNDALIGIPDTTFELSGTSDYGNDVVKTATSDENGLVKIENIEKGTYTLREIKANEDYVLNSAEYRVVVNDAGSVSLLKPDTSSETTATTTYEAADTICGQPVIFNTPAYWDVTFLKVDKDLPTRTLEGAEFTVTGASLTKPLTATSDADGIVTIKHLKAGSYVMTETTAPSGLNGEGKKPAKDKPEEGVLNYQKDPSQYLLTIAEDGTYTIVKANASTSDGTSAELSKNSNGDYIFPDERALDGQITIIKKWDDSDATQRKDPKIHLENSETGSRSTGVSVIVEWLNDSVTTRPNKDFEVIVRDTNGKNVRDSSTATDLKLSQSGNVWVYHFSQLDATESYNAYEVNLPEGYTGTAVGKQYAVAVVSGRARIQNTFSYSETFGFKGEEQTFTAPYTGYYKMEVWGAAGGNDSAKRGLGGYSTGTVYLTQGQILHIYVGGQGQSATTGRGGGWNGGGDAGNIGTSGGGGGMTHISTTQNPVDNHKDSNNTNHRTGEGWNPKGTLIVAGGGGGGGNGGDRYPTLGGFGGGETADAAGSGRTASNTDKTDYIQGFGQNRTDIGKNSDGGGAGAGWHGGYVNKDTYDYGAGGGTGYVADKLGNYPITNAQTIAGNQEFPNVDGTGTETGHDGNGAAKITFVSENSDVAEPVTPDSNSSTATNENEYVTNKTFGDDGGWTKVDDNTWKYVLHVFDDTAKYTYWEDPISGYASDAPSSEDEAKADSTVIDGSKGKTLVVTNTATTKYGSITVFKKVVDSAGNELTSSTQDFTFTLKLTNKDDSPLTGIIGENVFADDGTATFTLHEGESKKFDKIPAGTTYAVTEAENANYTLKSQDNSSGTITAGTESDVAFVNQYNPPAKSRQDVTLVKKIEGSVAGSENDDYTFHAKLTGLDPNLEFAIQIASSDSSTTTQNYMSDDQGQADVTLKLKADQKAVFKALPEGTTYRFVEDAGKWTARFQVINEKGEDGVSHGNIAGSSGVNTAENQELATQTETVDAGENTTVTYTNTLAYTQQLTVKKTIAKEVTQLDPNEKFEVTVTITGLKPGTKISTDSIGILAADDTGTAVKTFNMTKNQSVVFQNVPVSAQYQVTETANDYIGSYNISSRSGAIASGENTVANKDLVTPAETIIRNEDPTVELISGTHWSKVRFIKQAEDGTELRGANFTLYKGTGDARTEYRMDHNGAPVEGNSSGSAVITLGEKTLTLATGTYELVETKAPRGYVITNATITFMVNADGTVTVSNSENLKDLVTVDKDASDPTVQEIVIKNKAGTRLPSTGSIDVRILMIMALAMIGAALFGFHRLRKDDSPEKQ